MSVSVRNPMLGVNVHPDGVKVNTFDGELLVLDTSGKTLAVYAPGHWASVTVTEDPAGTPEQP